MRRCDIEGSLHILVRALSENEKAKVVIGGSSTCTDGQTVWMGSLPPNNELAGDLAFGKLFHECEHVDSTDFAVPKEDPVLWTKLGNILEDIRIERKRMSKYPGAKLALSRTVSAMIKVGGFSAVTSDAGPLAVLQGYVLYRLRNDCLGQDALSALADGAGAAFDGTFTPQLRNRVDALMYDAETASDTRQVMKIAGAIMKAFEDAAQDDPPQQPNDQKSDQGGKDDKQQPSAGQDSNGQGNDGKGDSPAPSGDQGKDDGKADNGGNAAGGGQQQAGKDDAAKQNMRNVLASSGGDGLEQFDETLNRLLNGVANSSQSGTLGDPLGATVSPNGQDGSVLISKVRSATTALRTRLAGYLQAQTLSSVSTARSGRRLDRNRVYRAEVGNTAIFRRSTEGRELDTAVYFLTDKSISMKRENRLRLAVDSVAAVSLALEHLTGVDTAIGVFPYAVQHGYGVGEVKSFGRPMRAAMAALNALQPSGGTPMAEAILWAGLSLYRTNRARKVLMVSTDGEPASRPLVEGVVADLERMGIEVVGIGIQTGAVAGLFKRYCVVNNLAELPRAVFGMMQESILLEAA